MAGCWIRVWLLSQEDEFNSNTKSPITAAIRKLQSLILANFKNCLKYPSPNVQFLHGHLVHFPKTSDYSAPFSVIREMNQIIVNEGEII